MPNGMALEHARAADGGVVVMGLDQHRAQITADARSHHRGLAIGPPSPVAPLSSGQAE